MDKLIITVIISALAALITAALSIVKLVSDKEGKTTDYRQAWTESARTAFAELITAINAQAATIKHEAIAVETLTKSTIDKDTGDAILQQRPEHITSFITDRLIDHQQAFHNQRKAIYSAFSTISLHFKNDDLNFSEFVEKFRATELILNEMKNESNSEKREQLKIDIHKHADALSTLARKILKLEWETIKQGEKSYQRIKNWSGWACLLLFAIIVFLGASAAFPAELDR